MIKKLMTILLSTKRICRGMCRPFWFESLTMRGVRCDGKVLMQWATNPEPRSIMATAMLLLILTANARGPSTQHKVPLRIVNVNGAVNNQYAIIQTTIYREPGRSNVAASSSASAGSNPAVPSAQASPWGDWSGGGFDMSGQMMNTDMSAAPALSQPSSQTSSSVGKPIVTRAQLDLIGPTNQSSTLLDVKLELPMPPVRLEQSGASQIIGKVGQVVGAVGVEAGQAMMQAAHMAETPKERAAAVAAAAAVQTGSMVGGAGIAGIGMLVDYANFVAEQQLDKLYENQQFRINLLEIIPTRYYSIDTQTNKVRPTKTFEREVKVYQDKIKEYLTALKAYQDVSSMYAQWHKRLSAVDSSGKNQTQWQQVRDYDAQTVRPALIIKNRLESELTRMFPPYRIAIMASPSAGGNTCGRFGSGPWELYVIYYLGAKQTNQIVLRYCVPNPKEGQTISIDLMQNAIQQIDPRQLQQKFMPGGVELVARQNATFSRATGFQSGDYGGTKTGVLNWFTKMVVSEEGDSIDNLLVPFDIHALRTEATEQVNARNKARMDQVTGTMDKMINQSNQARQRAMQMGGMGMMGGGYGGMGMMGGGYTNYAQQQFDPTAVQTPAMEQMVGGVPGAEQAPGASSIPVAPPVPGARSSLITPEALQEQKDRLKRVPPPLPTSRPGPPPLPTSRPG